MSEQAPPPPGVGPGWFRDFAWVNGRFVVRKTRVSLGVDHHLINEIASWLIWLVILGVATTAARLRPGRRPKIWFTPERPRPWYMIGGVALWAGIRQARTEVGADAAFYFDDVTAGEPPPTRLARRLNFGCTDVSKGRVAEVFEEVFGYPLSLDPETAVGSIVEKSETNGVHDGHVVTAPTSRRAGYAYQLLVDATDDAGLSRDLRTPCVGGEPIVVWIKVKPAGARFAIHNRKALLRDPADVYSAGELETIRRFNARMGLDWGGLDILRDRHTGRIYVVDANKTDLGPVIALSWRDKIVSMSRLAAALERLVAGT